MDRPRRSQRPRTARQLALMEIAKETLNTLPDLLKQLPTVKADASTMYDFDSLPRLDPASCPRLETKAVVKVVNQDSFNVAIDLRGKKPGGAQKAKVAVMNMASHKNPGGGWLSGAVAQEEALCYRSSLSLSLHKKYYPWKKKQGLYTEDVVIIRSAMDGEHALLAPETQPADLPVMSVVSIAAVCRPERRVVTVRDGDKVTQKEVYAKAEDREMTKDKMRLSLRIAAVNGHTVLVLGALGCGAFGNPTREVAQCWLEVLREPEFSGGWWQDVYFAVYDRRNEGNFQVFFETLEGEEV